MECALTKRACVALIALLVVLSVCIPAHARSDEAAALNRRAGKCEVAEPLFARALAASKGDIQELPILFATDRKRDGSQPSVAFTGGEPDQKLSLGLAVVTVPKDKEPVELSCLQVVTDKELIEAAVRRLALSKSFPNQAFIFVHGVNTSFENAVRGAAQIANELKFDGGTFVFSWPTRSDHRREYCVGQCEVEQENVEIAAEHLRQFLEKVVAETKATKVHFIAHSLGNLVLLRALESIANDAPALRPVIGEIIAAAPDVNGDEFEAFVWHIKPLGAKFTLYASASDKALWGSIQMGGWPSRAGFIADNKPLIVNGVETIDITSAGTGLFGINHSVYSTNPTIITDMRRIFESGEHPPDKRTEEFEAVVSNEGTYWRLRPEQAGAQ
jgi:esterase/lipase superfamily enzyme